MDIRAISGRLRRIPYPRTLAALAAVWILYLLAGYFLAPRWIAQAIPRIAEEQLQRKASVGDVLVNPLLFRVRIRDFALSEPDGKPIVGFRRLMVDFELSSLLRWAWTFSSIRLDGLDLHAEVRPDGTFNLAALRAKPGPGEAQAKGDGKPPRLLLQHAALRGGRVTFTDRTISTPTSAVVHPIDLELRDISTLPDPRGPYAVSAILRDGGVLFWRGDVSLHPIYSQGEIATRRIRLSMPWRFLRDRLDLAEPGGMIEFSARYRFSYADETTEFALENTRLAVTDVRLAAPGAREPMLALEAAEMTNGRFNLIQRELVVPSIEVYKGVVAAAADAKGAFDWQKIMKEPETAASPAAPAQGRPWKIRLESVHASEIALRLDDRSRVAPLTAGVADFEVRFAAEAELGGEAPQARVRGLDLRLGKVTLGELDAPAPIASLETVSLAGGGLDLGQRQVAVDRAVVSGGTVRLVRDKTGNLRIMDVLTAGTGRQEGEVAPIARAAAGQVIQWRATLDAFELGGVRVSLADETYEPAVAYDFDVARSVARDISSDGKVPVRFETALRVAQGGSASASGSLSDGYRRAAASLKVDRFALKPLQPVISRDGALKLESGELSADVKAEYRAGKERAQLRATGRAGIADFLLSESAGGDRLLRWKEIAATGVAFTLNPDRLTVEEVRLREPGAKIVIFKDRSLNLVKAFQPPAPDAQRAPDPPKPPAADAAPAAGPPLDIGVERVRVENGIVDFSDLSLVLPFAAKVEEFNGSATGISSDPAGAAALKLEGKVGEFGLASVDGTLKPFQPKAHTDIGVVFRNVEMVPLSPYSATFAARRIATGRVSLDLRYKVENSQLAGDNRVVLERFTLGEQVESPGAMRLPYDLAIALLTDSNGRINVAVPVKGNVDDPQFSYGHLIWQAISTVITNIVTAPFRALFGGGGENLESIAFAPGQGALQPPEREKLKRVAGTIAQRPQLILVAEGQYGEADAAALRERDVALAIAAKLGRAPAQGAAPDPVNPLDGRTQRAMEALFVERASGEALSRFVDETEKARGKPVDRANPVLAFAGRGSADVEFYQALLRRLNDTARVPDDSLRQLADARARAVAGHMRDTLSVPESRVAARTAKEPGAVVVKLSFDVAKPAQK
jgi:uncharacterized protein involved in outer membrane biogenesis